MNGPRKEVKVVTSRADLSREVLVAGDGVVEGMAMRDYLSW